MSNDSNGAGVTWTLAGAGSLSNKTSSSVTFTAPAGTSTPQTGTVTATSVAEATASASTALTIAALPEVTTSSTQSIVGVVGTAFSAQLQGSGGIPPYKWSVVPTAGEGLPPCVSLSSSGLLTTTSGNPPTVACAGSYTATFEFSDSGTPNALTAPKTQIGITFNGASFVIISGAVPVYGTVGQPYSGGSALASGGAGPLSYSITEGALPGGISLNATSAAIAGTPTAAGTFNFTVTAADAYGESDAQSYEIIVNSAGSTNDSRFKGTYACLTRGYRDQYLTPLDVVASLVADGQGNILSGQADIGDPDSSQAFPTTVSGSYNVGTDNNGTISIQYDESTLGTFSRSFAFALSNAAAPAQQVRMIEDNDIGNQPSGEHGTADCYLADPSAFNAATLDNSFVMGLSGQYQPGTTAATAEAVAGRFDATGGTISNGYLETASAGLGSTTSAPFTGSFGTVDPSSGKVAVTFAGSQSNLTFVFYLIDSTRALVLETTPYTGISDLEAGEARVQQQKSWTLGNFDGPVVLYGQGVEILNANGYSRPSGYYSQVIQGTADGKGTFTLNRSYKDDNGLYSTAAAGGTTGLSFDPNVSGRAAFEVGGNPISLYFFDTNQAIEVGVAAGSIETGRLEFQTEKTFSGAAIAGKYLVSELPLASFSQTGSTGEFALGSDGSITGDLSTAGQGVFTSEQPVALSYQWDPVATGTGTFLISGPIATGTESCAVITAVRSVCIPQTDALPFVMELQQ